MSPWVRRRHQPVIMELVLEVLGAGSEVVFNPRGGAGSAERTREAQGREHLSNVSE